ncbi:MAG: ribokinase [Verrucomicrobiaceae bacterium]|nr:ribokinase [Verrucomicrobiaceae bacterium]
MGNVVVLGSLNYDCLAVVDEFPKPGQTLAARTLDFKLGGKGANQAVAAARQGANVAMIGCVGDDGAGVAYIDYLKRRNVVTAGIVVREEAPTGTALICVRERDGENTIVVGGGANETLTPAEVEAQQPLIAMGRIMLAQLEVPSACVVAGLKMARPMGTATCLNPSPWRDDFPWGGLELDFVIVNEEEAAALLGRRCWHLGDADWVLQRTGALRIDTLIVTRGASSTLAFSSVMPCIEVPAMKVEPVDTVGAGDCFAGAFAARWAENREFEKSLRAANVAGALATLERGAQEAIPPKEAVDEALANLS